MSHIPTTTGRGRRLGAQVSVWLSQEESAALDALAARYGPDVSRPEAVRRAVADLRDLPVPKRPLLAQRDALQWALSVLILAVIGKAQPPPAGGVTTRWLVYMAGVAAAKARRHPEVIRAAVEGVRAKYDATPWQPCPHDAARAWVDAKNAEPPTP